MKGKTAVDLHHPDFFINGFAGIKSWPRLLLHRIGVAQYFLLQMDKERTLFVADPTLTRVLCDGQAFTEWQPKVGRKLPQSCLIIFGCHSRKGVAAYSLYSDLGW